MSFNDHVHVESKIQHWPAAAGIDHRNMVLCSPPEPSSVVCNHSFLHESNPSVIPGELRRWLNDGHRLSNVSTAWL